MCRCCCGETNIKSLCVYLSAVLQHACAPSAHSRSASRQSGTVKAARVSQEQGCVLVRTYLFRYIVRIGSVWLPCRAYHRLLTERIQCARVTMTAIAYSSRRDYTSATSSRVVDWESSVQAAASTRNTAPAGAVQPLRFAQYGCGGSHERSPTCSTCSPPVLHSRVVVLLFDRYPHDHAACTLRARLQLQLKPAFVLLLLCSQKLPHLRELEACKA
jgi:hypothetical protein